jgi:transcriptional antiterminator NusG
MDIDRCLWFAVCTRSRHEKYVAEQLTWQKIEHLLPLYSSARRWTDRVKTLRLPLFPGYLFAKIVPSQFSQVLRAHGVATLVGSPKPVPLQDAEIEQIHKWISLPVGMEPNPYLQVGLRVRVREGPLSNLEGIVIRKKSGFRLVVSIETIQRSVALEIDSADLVPLGRANSFENQVPILGRI